MEKFKQEWLKNPFVNIIAGILVGLALIPEAISFSIIAGVDPMVGLYASVIIAITISITGGRSAMVSAATAAVALVVVNLVQDHGVEYLLLATILMGIIQVLLGIFKVGRLLRFIPNSVMIGFINSLAIMLFITQMQHILGITIHTYIYAFITLALVFIIPRFYTKIPAPLIVLVGLTIVYLFIGGDVRTVGDLGSIEKSFPKIMLPDVPFTFETFKIILPYSVSMALVGLIESLIVARIVDNYTETPSNKNRESLGQGIANIFAGFFGGMGGCAMAGQTIINITSGARTRLSTFTAGAFLMFLIVVLGDIVVRIPMPILAGIMTFIAINTFDWRSFQYVRRAPKTDVIVMLVTMAGVLATNNLAVGTILGVILAALLFARKISEIDIDQYKKDNAVIFEVTGQLFFASVESFIEQLTDYDGENTKIIIDFEHATLWDSTAVEAIQTAILNFEKRGYETSVINLNTDSKYVLNRMTKITTD
ncbi:SulP family inorganic anion transporter [Phocicoccus pinnipedialis]|uniref:C4-dicarboxylic acid transporter DauA n=1 Tax=Phocicoccus pinnipedialis TaxID=110845 RepID=A0A6V7R4N9_9BACL|nr:SulP family inorganic anion transporter [Jeotgalicoccus pinnipedialis]MBP1939781.1 SulP family sulfate permease [Jeotgalicoccus pinnipedialis]CAD2072409.1 C4-dicarboxylic acid transporter DauA [Jeotgalicoccus pinnipedialis]